MRNNCELTAVEIQFRDIADTDCSYCNEVGIALCSHVISLQIPNSFAVRTAVEACFFCMLCTPCVHKKLDCVSMITLFRIVSEQINTRLARRTSALATFPEL
jgi:hypothetical protein